MTSRRHILTSVPITILAFLLGGHAAATQDAVRVSPETHRVLLENNRVRVLEVRVKPGEKVAMHSHPDSMLYYLSDAKLKITYPDGKSEEREVKAGTAVWSKAVTHMAENVGSTELHEIHTELKEAVKHLPTSGRRNQGRPE